MWLIDTNTLQLKEFIDEREIRYAILSHRWENDEVSFKDMMENTRSQSKAGFWKIKMCCEEAAKSGIPYAWVDTCCIDKSSSAELQEAINSMFRWYRNSEICFAYLSDVEGLNMEEFGKSLWFTRGWTLQELIAPIDLSFYSRTWSFLGSRAHISADLADITKIPRSILLGTGDILKQCVAERMSWARGRTTARIEDRAYSLMGLFDVNMPMLYGEGDKAFIRLQEEILRRSNDQSIFAWTGIEPIPSRSNLQKSSLRLFARSPDDFPQTCAAKTWSLDRLNISSLSPNTYHSFSIEAVPFFERRSAALLTHEGVEIELSIIPWKPRVYLACLNYSAGPRSWPLSATECIFIRQIGKLQRFVRVRDILYGDLVGLNLSEVRTPSGPLILYPRLNAALSEVRRLKQVTIVQNLLNQEERMVLNEDPCPGYHITQTGNASFVELYGNLDSTKTIVTMTPGQLGPAAIISFNRDKFDSSLGKFPFRVLLGFDLDFQATIVIQGDHYFNNEAHPELGNINSVAWKLLEDITCIESEGWIPLRELRLHKCRTLSQANLPLKLGPPSLEYSNFYFSIHSRVIATDELPDFRISIQRYTFQQPLRIMFDFIPFSTTGGYWLESFSKATSEEQDSGECDQYRLELNY